MKRVLLINPWIADFAAFDLWSKPLGLLYVGKFLKQYGYDIDLIDLLDRLKWGEDKTNSFKDGRGKYRKTIISKPNQVSWVPRKYGLYGASREEFVKALLKAQKPDAILLTSYMTYWYPGVKKTVEILREILPKIPIILGGIYASLYPRHAMETIEPDYLITGYGEKKSLILLDSLFNIIRDYQNIPETNDNGILPWELYPELESVPLLTSRGCPFKCSYCATRLLHPQFIQKNTDKVVEEIITIHDKFGVKDFALYDDALFVNKNKHIIPILRGVIDSGIKVNFHTPNGLLAREIDKNLAILMKEAEFKTIRLSLESIIPNWQNASSSKVNTESFLSALENLEQAGYESSEIEVYLLMGLPGQTFEDVKRSIEFVFNTGAISRLASFSPIPGTTEWERAKKFGHVWDNMDPILTNNTLFPCRSENFPIEKFLELKQLSNHLNSKIRNLKTVAVDE